MVSGAPNKLKATLTPESFRSGQADLLKQASLAAKARASPCHRRLPLPPLLPGSPCVPTPFCPQAADVEAFLARRTAAGAQKQAHSAWLLAQQELEQEAADSEAQLLDCLSAAIAHPSLLHQLLLPDEGAEDAPLQHGSLPAASEAVGAAAALASEAARLLHTASPASVIAGLQQHMAGSLTSLQGDLSSLQATAGCLLSDIQRAQRQVTACYPAEGCLKERLAQLYAAHPLAPASCTAQLRAEAAALQARHAQQRQDRQSAWQAFLASTRQQAGSAAAPDAAAGHGTTSCALFEADSPRSSSSGGHSTSWQSTDALTGCTADGWTAEEHAVFLAARKSTGLAGSPGSALVRQLAALLPARSAAQVAAHERWHREASRLQSAAQQGEAGAHGESAAFLSTAAALLAQAEGQRLQQAGAALQQLEAAAASLLSGGTLDQQREQRGAAAEWDEVARFEAAAAAAAQQAERRRQDLEWRDQMKLLIAQHKERLAAEAAAAAATEQAAAAAAAREAAVAAALGQQRVACRAAQVEAKRACRAQQEASRQQERQRRQEALDALAAQVAPAVQRDAARATGSTESSAAAAGVEQQRHGLFARALGFTADQLLADQRFKVHCPMGVGWREEQHAVL